MNPNTQPAVESTLKVEWNLPLWVIALAALFFAAFAGWVYWRERGAASLGVRFGLAAIRTALLLLVLWMILGWSWQRALIENPELVIAVDVSESMLTPDGAAVGSQSSTGTTRLEQIQRLLDLSPGQLKHLQQHYRLRFYFVAGEASPAEFEWQDLNSIPWSEIQASDLQVDQSRLGDSLIRIIERQAGRGTAAVLFFSDGIVTSGRSLQQAGERAQRSAIPIHAVAVGSQMAQPDLRVSELLAEDQVFLGDRVNVEATIAASDIRESTVSVQLTDLATRRVLDQKSVSLSAQDSQGTLSLNFIPEESGEINLEVSVQEFPGEVNTSNNRAEWTLNVLDRKIRVLLGFDQPSYEFRYLKNFLERSSREKKNSSSAFELTSILQSSDLDYVAQDISAARFIPTGEDQLSEFDVFILGALDPSLIPPSTQAALVRSVTHGGAGCIFIVSNENSLRKLLDSNLGGLLPIDSAVAESKAKGNFSISVTRMGQSIVPFELHSGSNNRKSILQLLPPLQSVLEVGKLKSGAQVLVEADSRRDDSQSPLLISQFAGAGRVAVLATDETYRWTSVLGSDAYHQQFWGQLLRWLSRGRLTDVSETQLIAEPKQAKLGEAIQLRLSLANSLRAVSQAQIKISGPDEMERIFELNRVVGSTSAYQGSVDQLPPGSYRAVMVRPALPSPPATDFTVVAPQSEQANLKVDLEAMKQLAEKSQGRFWHADQASRWYDALPPGRPVRLGVLPAQPLWNQNWVALLFVLLITTEWLLRRRARML